MQMGLANSWLVLHAGLGLTGIVADRQTAVGNSRLMAQECVYTSAFEAREAEWAQKGRQCNAEICNRAKHKQTPCVSSVTELKLAAHELHEQHFEVVSLPFAL